MTLALAIAFLLIFVLAFWLVILTMHTVDIRSSAENATTKVWDLNRRADGHDHWQRRAEATLVLRQQETQAIAGFLHLRFAYRAPQDATIVVVETEKPGPQPSVDTHA